MILRSRQRTLDVPAKAVASIALLQAPAGSVTVRTALMRIPATDMATRDRTMEGQPVCYAAAPDGRTDIWPTPNADFPAEIRARSGEIIGDPRRRAGIVPVEQHAAVITKAYEEARRAAAQPGRVERFTLAGTDDDG